MNKNQAFELIAQATGELRLSRAEHQKVVQALELLKPVEETPAEE